MKALSIGVSVGVVFLFGLIGCQVAPEDDTGEQSSSVVTGPKPAVCFAPTEVGRAMADKVITFEKTDGMRCSGFFISDEGHALTTVGCLPETNLATVAWLHRSNVTCMGAAANPGDSYLVAAVTAAGVGRDDPAVVKLPKAAVQAWGRLPIKELTHLPKAGTPLLIPYYPLPAPGSGVFSRETVAHDCDVFSSSFLDGISHTCSTPKYMASSDITVAANAFTGAPIVDAVTGFVVGIQRVWENEGTPLNALRGTTVEPLIDFDLDQ